MKFKTELVYKILAQYSFNATLEICEETETFTVDVDCIEEGEEFETLQELNKTLEQNGFRIIADDSGSKIGKIWTIFE